MELINRSKGAFMKRYTPYIFPTVVFLIVIFLVWRWYDLRAERAAQRLYFGEGIQIEDLTDSEQLAVKNGVGDFQTVELERPTTDGVDGEEKMGEGTGVFRYEIQNDRVVFSVIADLPKLSTGAYQVWLKQIDGDTTRKAFRLSPGKGGYEGSAEVPSELLPFEVVVSQEELDDEKVEVVVLRGVVRAEAMSELE
jgi:hypothetical protein